MVKKQGNDRYNNLSDFVEPLKSARAVACKLANVKENVPAVRRRYNDASTACNEKHRCTICQRALNVQRWAD